MDFKSVELRGVLRSSDFETKVIVVIRLILGINQHYKQATKRLRLNLYAIDQFTKISRVYSEIGG